MTQEAEVLSPEVTNDWEVEQEETEQVTPEQQEPDESEPEEEAEEGQEEAEGEGEEGETEDEFFLGDEKLESPASEEDEEVDGKPAPNWVKDLRKQHKDQAKRIKELESQLETKQAAPQADTVTELPPRPTLESVDYDEDKLEAEWAKWYEVKRKLDEQQAKQKDEQAKLQEIHQEKVKRYNERKAQVKVQGYDIAEQAVISEVPQNIQSAIIHYAESPEMVVLALGRNAELRAKAAKTTDPVELGRLIGNIEARAKVAPKVNRQPSVTPQVKGGNGAKQQSAEDRALYAAFPDAQIT